ncbi:exosortase C-terminal domain/associated protein EpsI [Desulfofustis glycolicus]|uniref:EpsI family protein n=1 Tax=Desulfofustis glycolicus DSM 9705 TaxID=1121409 RepID=A0A1M5YUI5_9BACT|nr:exosortase C-terminal domain/associated protein EpsI [Desulfofustis glycolicus]SHI15736.1 EpsI family protein [Desulfofustis glycolicus DSM 9705]
MRKISYRKLLTLIVVLIVTGSMLYWQPQAHLVQPQQSLSGVLSQMRQWRPVETNSLSPVIIKELKLDDYVFQTYSKNDETITIYIGYYLTGKKIGAAHDPQVCYPGQGWQLYDKQTREINLAELGIIEYSTIVAELDGKKEKIFYWFQVDDISAPSTFKQKLLLLQKKILGQGQMNAFVRISTSINDKSEESAQSLLIDFINEFYPILFLYMTAS